jgi:hypothetical protein
MQYLGKDDTLYSLIDYNIKKPYKCFLPLISDENKSEKIKIKNLPLKIIIDTSNIIGINYSPIYELDSIGVKIPDDDNLQRIKVDGYPVYIINNNNVSTWINNQGCAVDLIQEAKDIDGSWRPIERHYYGFCGNGYSKIIIAPKYYVK